MNKNKALLSIDDPIFLRLAPEGSFLQDCLTATRWDDENNGSNSLIHYNVRLSVSKLLKLVGSNNSGSLVKLLSSPSKLLSIKDVVQGFKSAELLLKDAFSINKAKTYSRNFRSFAKHQSGPLLDANNVSEIHYESILWANSDYQKNSEVSLFEIQIKGKGKSITLIDPDFYPSLFKKTSVLSLMMKNLEASSRKNPITYSEIAVLKSLLRDITTWPNSSPIKVLLNTPFHSVNTSSLNAALLDFERRLYSQHPQKKNHNASTTFRKYLFTYALTLPEHTAEKIKFKTNFNQVGNLKFKPSYTIQTTDQPQYIDSFMLPSVLPTESLGEICFSCLEEKTRIEPAQETEIKKLIEVLKIVEQSSYRHARLLFKRKPKDLMRFHVTTGVKELKEIICDCFPQQEEERLAILRSFINLCPVPIKNGKLICELSFDLKTMVEDKPQTLTIKTYKKTNGKKKVSFYQFNLTKIADLLCPNGLLTVSLNALEKASNTVPVPYYLVSMIAITLRDILNAADNAAIKYALTNRLVNLRQRDFRLGFSNLEDIIEAQDIKSKAAKSQTLRTFLNKYAGKIDGKVEIKNCGFSTRFNADESKAQKLIEPVDENGEILPSPILEKHLSLDKLRKRYHEYLTQPINAILDACKREVVNYKRLLKDLAPYTSTDESGKFTFPMPNEATALVLGNQLREEESLRDSKITQLIERHTKQVLLGAFVRHQLTSDISINTRCQRKSKLIPDYVAHWFPKTGKGMKDLFWSSVFLPKYILLVCFIRLVIRTSWNKDVVATLDRSNLPNSLPEGPFTIGGFKEKVSKHTTPVTIEPHEKEIREAINFLIQHHDNMVSYGLIQKSLWDTPDSQDLSFLLSDTINNFINHHTLPYFRMELLAKHQINLRKGIDGNIVKSQMERNHGSLRVTKGYLSHPIAQLEYEANSADFQRRLETTVQFRDNKESIKKYGFDSKNIDEDLLIAPSEDKEELPDWFILPDGSTCTDIFAPVDKPKKGNICRGRLCHKGDGCQFNRVEIGVEELVHTLRHQVYYISRGTALLDKHGQHHFDEYIAPNMRFTFGLAKYVELANPSLFRAAKRRLDNAQ